MKRTTGNHLTENEWMKLTCTITRIHQSSSGTTNHK